MKSICFTDRSTRSTLKKIKSEPPSLWINVCRYIEQFPMPKKLIFPKFPNSTINININNILILKQNHRPYNLLTIKHCTVRLTCSLPLRIKKKQNNYNVCCQTHAVNNPNKSTSNVIMTELGVTPTLRSVDLLLVDDQHGDLLSETGQLVL